MSLFVVQHSHAAETCPAGHPEMGPMLVQHVSQENAAKFGVTVHSEAVAHGQPRRDRASALSWTP